MDLPYAVYILKCSNGQYYTGITENINKRLVAHQKGEVHFTKDKLPVELLHLSLFPNKRKLVISSDTLNQALEQLFGLNDFY